MSKRSKRWLIFLLVLIVPPLLIGILTVILMKWPLRTRISARITTTHTNFTVGSSEQTRTTAILNSVNVHSLGVENFSAVKLTPESMLVAAPDQYLLESDSYPESAWSPLSLSQPAISLMGVGGNFISRVTIERISPAVNLRLEDVQVTAGSNIKLEAQEESRLNLHASHGNEAARVSIMPSGEFLMVADYCKLEAVHSLPFQQASLTYKAKLPVNNPTLDIEDASGSLIFIIRFPQGGNSNPFSTRPIPVTGINFTHIDESNGQVLSALAEGTTIDFPDYPNKEDISVNKSDFISLNQLENFSINELEYKPLSQTITLFINGTAGEVKSGPGGFLRDLRVTAFDYIWHSNVLIKLFSIVGWVVCVIVAGYKLFQELNKGAASTDS